LKEISHVKRIFHYLPLFLLTALFLPLAHAQYGFDFGLGFGAIQDSANGSGTEGNPAVTYPYNYTPCTIGSDATCIANDKLSGFTMSIGGNVMAWKHFGIGAEVNFQPSKSNYVAFPPITEESLPAITIQSRLTLYDFNGIYQPVRTKRAAFQVIGGVGGANLRFYEAGTTGSTIGASNFSEYFGSNNHFQVHGGVAVQIYLTDHVFLRPQFDVHYVPNFVQYGRNVVTSETVWLGYTFGSQ